MDNTLIEKLIHKYNVLIALNEQFKESLSSDHLLPVWLPEPYLQNSRELAIKALTRLWNHDADDYPLSGMICASNHTAMIAVKLNTAKKEFKDVISEIKKDAGQQKTRVSTLIERVLSEEKGRPEAIVKALKKAQIGRLNLLDCYKKIQILPSNLKSISWTWAKQHKEINRISRQDAVDMIESLNGTETREIVSKLLDQHPEYEPLAYVKGINRQLRANLVWVEGNQIKRKPIVTSNIVVISDKTLPRKFKWANDDSPERLSRSDIEISSEPYIRALN
ncbi:MAG: hypothetical protein OEY89_13360, partial [Gammaproteobacteria bacterium]|nr:hypothetical protein [Gammaproteobacteria bacterium]